MSSYIAEANQLGCPHFHETASNFLPCACTTFQVPYLPTPKQGPSQHPQNEPTRPARVSRLPRIGRHYSELADFQHWLLDAVIVAIDLEGIDHRNGIDAQGLENWEKVSEVGVSYIDLRDVRLDSGSTSAVIPEATSTERLSNISKSIVTHHVIINRWRNFTEETCDAPYHKTHKKPHTAMPYHCMVAESQFGTHEEAISDLDRLLRDLSTRNLTAEEIEAGMHRKVRVIYWDAGMESNWFHDMDFDVGSHGAIQWDFQRFRPFFYRFWRPRTGAEEAFLALGALGTGAGGMAVLHNAANDTFTQLVAFLRFLVMTSGEWELWCEEWNYELDPVDLSWISDEIWKANQELRPHLQPGEEPEEVEDLEPVVVHQSLMAQIQAGVTSATVGRALTSNTWANAVRKPVSSPTEMSSATTSQTSSSRQTCTPQTSRSSSWALITPLASACVSPEPVEDHRGKTKSRPRKRKPACITLAAAPTASPTIGEESEWTIVSHSKGNASSSPQSGKYGKKSSKHGNRSTRVRPAGKRQQIVNTSRKPNMKGKLTAAQPVQTANKPASAREQSLDKPKPVAEPSAASLHWAKFCAAVGNRPD